MTFGTRVFLVSFVASALPRRLSRVDAAVVEDPRTMAGGLNVYVRVARRM